MNGGRLSVSTKHIAKEEKSGIRIISTIKKYWFIYLLAIPGFIFLVFFSYGPMYGIVLAFKDYKMNLGVLGSPWVGLAHYRELLSDPSFIQAFKNTIIIMTSNIGAHIIQERLKGIDENNRDEVLDKTNHEVYEMLKQTIRPEFLNRIDEIIMFAPLKKSEIVDIVRLQFNGVKKMLENNGIAIEITEEAVRWLADAGYDPQFGARPVKRVIQRTLLNDLSKQILAEEVSKDSRIMVDVKDDKIVFENK